MSCEMKWLVKDAVICGRLSGSISIQKMRENTEQLRTMLDQSDRVLVHTVIDGSEVTHLTNNIRQIVAETSHAFQHPRLGWTILYGHNLPILKFVATTIMQIFRTRYRMFSSAEEALSFLQEQDVRLPQLHVDDLISTGGEKSKTITDPLWIVQ